MPAPMSPRTSTSVRSASGELLQCQVQDADVVRGVVRVRPPGAQHPGQRLPRALRAVVGEGEKRMKPEGALARATG